MCGRLRSRNVRSCRARGIARAHRGERVEMVRLPRGGRRALLLQQTPRLGHRGARHLHGLAAAGGERGDAGHDTRAGRGNKPRGVLRGRFWRLEWHARARLGCARASVEVASLCRGGGGVAESSQKKFPVKRRGALADDAARPRCTRRVSRSSRARIARIRGSATGDAKRRRVHRARRRAQDRVVNFDRLRNGHITPGGPSGQTWKGPRSRSTTTTA